MLVWMSHPQHGRMPVYDMATRALNLARGWVVDPEPKPAKPTTLHLRKKAGK